MSNPMQIFSIDWSEKRIAKNTDQLSSSDRPTSILNTMSLSALAEHCMSEINKYRHGEAYNDQYCLEIFRRALVKRDQDAWAFLQQRFSDTVRGWLRRHPQREVAYHYDSEENYVAQTFARFWQATARNEKLEFTSLAALLRYLRASLNGAIVDTLRAYSRPKETVLPEPDSPGEPLAEDEEDGGELWEVIRSLLPTGREQRLAYLLFHCSLKPREIVRYCQQEFGDIREIYRMRRNITDRLLRHADHIRWRLSGGGLFSDRLAVG